MLTDVLRMRKLKQVLRPLLRMFRNYYARRRP